ncbi:MAG: glutamine synthetase family protein [Gammaproteobacteria bacterium]|nr:glutamine synthetase family protein [Gammaproteobacteria bacterium]NNF61805.1 glutamine synthetase [Gammaproteobacteria bacterium]NNM19729.1 glutamine synthetase [Gammaproteobacteria bacterium]
MTDAMSGFLQQHADLEFIDLLMPDLNGIARGKRLSASDAGKAVSDGILLPRSLYGGDIRGDTVEETRLGIATGDMDYTCRLETETLRPVPWADTPAAQCMMEMYDDSGQPFSASPRQLLREIVRQMNAAGLFPTVAVELEFYLLRDRLDDAGRPQLLIDPFTGEESDSTQVYSIDDLDNFRPFLETAKRYCSAQSVPASAAVAEYAPGQFEINLSHKADALAACDDAIYLKRIVRQAARSEQMSATFMAKPMMDQTGSGTHVHVSICDENGNNRFAASEAELHHAIGGLQATMSDAMLLFAPHANSYRRFRKNAYVPLSPSWGYNNRTVALRVPAGPEHARRIEHRVAGADANPYLVVAGVLAGILHGYREKLLPDQPVEGDAVRQRPASLPTDWDRAIELLADSDWAEHYFGADFQQLYSTIKRAEYDSYQSHVPPLDIQWYLQIV